MHARRHRSHIPRGGLGIAIAIAIAIPAAAYEFNDSHFHLTNFVQQGPTLNEFLKTCMGDRVGRVALFGIPLQQTWSYKNSGDFGPTYYLRTDAPLYYYSFTDAVIAMAYRALPRKQQARFDPMITGFNPADMYGVDHIRRVLEMFPGVFTGIGEFTIHKEFVSSKVAGEVASLTDPALDRILAFAGEVGLVTLIHNDIDVPFAKEGAEPVYLSQMKDLLRRHPETVIIWAHTGLGRVIHPPEAATADTERSPRHREIVEAMLTDPTLEARVLRHFLERGGQVLHGDSGSRSQRPPIWSTATRTGSCSAPTRSRRATRRPTRACFSSMRRSGRRSHPRRAAKVRMGNYERIFDEGRRRVRAWEKANPH